MKQKMKENYTSEKEQIPFTMIPNELLTSKTLSLKAKGLYSFMYSKKNDWNFTIPSMSKQLKEGKQSISNALKELKKEGWITYTPKKHEGKFIGGVYAILINQAEPSVNTPQPAFQHTGKYPVISNKDYNNIDTINTIHSIENNRKETYINTFISTTITKSDGYFDLADTIYDNYNTIKEKPKWLLNAIAGELYFNYNQESVLKWKMSERDNSLLNRIDFDLFDEEYFIDKLKQGISTALSKGNITLGQIIAPLVAESDIKRNYNN